MESPPPVIPLSRLVPWVIAAGLAAAVAWLTALNFSLRNQNTSLQTERELAEVAYRMTQNQLEERSLLAERMITDLGTKLRRSGDLSRLKISALVALADDMKEAQAIVVWDQDQQAGMLTLEKLPANTNTQDYQIWIVDPASKDPINGGVFNVPADGRATLAFKPDQSVTQAAAFAISLEKKGGAPKAEGPIIFSEK